MDLRIKTCGRYRPHTVTGGADVMLNIIITLFFQAKYEGFRGLGESVGTGIVGGVVGSLVGSGVPMSSRQVIPP
jgi:hypothetical protein